MTPELQRRLDSVLPPFDGTCIHSIRDLSLTELRELLVATASILSKSFPDIHSSHDWHEHDGFLSDSKPDSWIAVSSACSTDRTLFDSRGDDMKVRIALFPPTFDWLLRYNIDEDDEGEYNTATCAFDLSIAKNHANSGLIDFMLTQHPNLLTKCITRLWFTSNYGG
jgi:hypothetical protein